MFCKLSSSDYTAYTWSEGELAGFNSYMAGLPPWAPSATSSSSARAGHNTPPGSCNPAERSGKLPWGTPAVAELTAEEAKQARRERFEQLARENLRGLYLAQLKCLMRAADDPRVTKAHWQVLTRIIRHTNTKTGMSYPGRQWLAGDVVYYDDDRRPQRYEPQDWKGVAVGRTLR